MNHPWTSMLAALLLIHAGALPEARAAEDSPGASPEARAVEASPGSLPEARAADAAGNGATLHRFLLVVGANNGGHDRVKLSYARTDAESMARVLRQLGGVHSGDSTVLLDPSVDELRNAFGEVSKRVTGASAAGERTEMMFYFSGHSDEQGLLLAGRRLTYREVREALDLVPADVRIAVLDSCASGALTRLKGGTWRAPFQVDTSASVKGQAFLTSSSANEAAQESDAIGGSFFTHYMVSGLRGAADMSRDGRVTLNEAYQYAFSETLARTEATRGGAQHPSYDFQLTGSGDVVLTDLHGTSAMLDIPKEVDGRLFVRDAEGHLVAEVNKASGAALRLGLEPGEYTVTWQRKAELRRGSFTLQDGKVTVLEVSLLTIVASEATALRGDSLEPASLLHPGDSAGSTDASDIAATVVPFSVAIVPGLSTNSGAPRPVENHFSLTVITDRADILSGVEVAGIAGIRSGRVDGAQLSGIISTGETSVEGFQAAGVVASAGNGLDGAQLAGVVNIVSGDVEGSQIGGVVNIADGEVVGAQAAGIANIASREVTGLQGAAIANIDGTNMTGVQAAAVSNVVNGHAAAVQGAAIANVAKSLSGVQVSGVANWVERDVTGIQVSATANYCGERVHGVQVGVVNIAKSSDFSLGIVNIMWEGRTHLEFWGNDSGFMNVGLKHGGDYWHSIYAIGYQPGIEEEATSAALGVGGHLPVSDRLFLDFDLLSQWVRDEGIRNVHLDPNVIATFRIVAGFRILDWLTVFGGPSANLLVSGQKENPGRYAAFGADVNWAEGNGGDNPTVQAWPGFAVGVQLF